MRNIGLLLINKINMTTYLNNLIRIHPKGAGRVTDQIASKSLKSQAPHAFHEAQDLVVATSKYIKKSGLFSTEKSRLLKIQSSYYRLKKALRDDNFLEQEVDKKGSTWITVEYLSLFSDAFPNWQPEYEILNRLIPHL